MEDEQIMCTRAEVQDMFDRSNREIHAELKVMKDERKEYMQQIAREEVQTTRDSIFKFIGIGGVIAALSLVWYGGGLTSDVSHLQLQVTTLSTSMDKLNTFMSTGDRFTLEDGNRLKDYSDQQDELLQKQISNIETVVKEGFDDIKKEIRLLSD